MVHSAKYWVPIVPFALGTVVHNVYMYMYHKSSIKVLKGFFFVAYREAVGGRVDREVDQYIYCKTHLCSSSHSGQLPFHQQLLSIQWTTKNMNLLLLSLYGLHPTVSRRKWTHH